MLINKKLKSGNGNEFNNVVYKDFSLKNRCLSYMTVISHPSLYQTTFLKDPLLSALASFFSTHFYSFLYDTCKGR